MRSARAVPILAGKVFRLIDLWLASVFAGKVKRAPGETLLRSNASGFVMSRQRRGSTWLFG
jgi:hypothetical protein